MSPKEPLVRTFTIIGPSDVTKLERHAGVGDYQAWLQELAVICSKYFDQLFFIPDHGTYVDFATTYLAVTDSARVTAVMPSKEAWLQDRATTLGVSNVQIMDRGTGWTYLNTHFTGLAPYSLCIGYSAGSLLELAASKYLRLYENRPTIFFIDERAISGRLPKEIEEDIGTIHYFSSATQLDKLLYENT